MLKTLIHASDIANGALKYKTYLKWSALLAQEFDHQVRCEEKNGFKATAYLRYSGLMSFYKGQVFFLGELDEISS